MKQYTSVILLELLMLLSGCKKFIEVDAPINNINAANVFLSDATATAVLTGIYQKMSRQNSDNFDGTEFLTNLYTSTGLTSDELTLIDPNHFLLRFYLSNNLISTSAPGYWNSIYGMIFTANSAIEGLENNIILTSAIKQQLLGEAKFIRAFCYFYLVNFYGDVPLALSTDHKINTQLDRTPRDQVYEQIIDDLKDAKNLLSEQYLQGDALTPYRGGAEERVRPTKWAATALLARAYLYSGDYSNAESEATTVVNNVSLFELDVLDNVFLKNNREAIWQLMPVNNSLNANTGEGKFFVLPDEGPSLTHPSYLRNELANSFEPGDERKSKWIGSITVGTETYYFPFKYKIGRDQDVPTSEYPTIFRLAELYLIRAEARAQQNNLIGAAEDIDAIRNRAGLLNTTASTKEELLDAVLHERRVELFTEWGHRWFDLIRTGNADPVLEALKGSNWQSTDQLFPIPQSELAKSPGLKGQQNPGY